MEPISLLASLAGPLLSSAASFFGGQSAQKQQEKTNVQNFQNQLALDATSVQRRVLDAKAAGINPLAALGYSGGSSYSAAVGSSAAGEGMAKAGQDLGRAVGALMPREDKQAQLEQELTKAKIDAVRADITHQSLLNSELARKVAAAGTPPARSSGVPLPRTAPWKVGRYPLYQDFYDRRGGTVTGLSDKASQSFMNIHSAPLVPEVGAKLLAENYGPSHLSVADIDAMNAWSFRPDVRRVLENYHAGDTQFYSPF